MGTNTFYHLCANKFLPEKERTLRNGLSVKEKGVTYIMTWDGKCYSSVFSIDGYLIHEGNKCDKLIVLEYPVDTDAWANVFVELKGSNIRHAIEQLEATLCHSLFHTEKPTRLYARVVSNTFPSKRNNPEWEKAQIRFKQKYRCELKRVKSNQPDKFRMALDRD